MIDAARTKRSALNGDDVRIQSLLSEVRRKVRRKNQTSG